MKVKIINLYDKPYIIDNSIQYLYNICMLNNIDNHLSETYIESFDFTEEGIEKIRELDRGTNWPVVYLLESEKKVKEPSIYVGETSSVYSRMKQHFSNKEKKDIYIKNYILINEKFNKSAILDIENFLIEYLRADGKFKLGNKNNGLKKFHDYYQKQLYRNLLPNIWGKLKKLQLVNKELIEIENSNIFKFSPFKVLTNQQYDIQYDLIKRISFSIFNNEKQILLVKGGAGTGKSVLAISLIKYLYDILNSDYNPIIDKDSKEEDNLINDFELNKVLIKHKKNINKIALVEPVPAFKDELIQTFNKTEDLKNIIVINPSDIVKQGPFDIVIVDEAHRLKQRKKLFDYKSFDANCEKLKMDKSLNTELDWIIANTKYSLILFYDENQKIKISDIDSNVFKEIENKNKKENNFLITNQIRIKAGPEYIKLWKKILNNQSIESIDTMNFRDYSFKIFDHCIDMFNQIQNDDKRYGLSRVVSGNTHKWGVNMKENWENQKDKMVFTIEGKEYTWNRKKGKKSKPDEIGCVYTCQGFDLNYCGVIIGKDLRYNKGTKQIEFNFDNFTDEYSKLKDNPEITKQNIINQYLVLDYI